VLGRGRVFCVGAVADGENVTAQEGGVSNAFTKDKNRKRRHWGGDSLYLK